MILMQHFLRQVLFDISWLVLELVCYSLPFDLMLTFVHLSNEGSI